MMLHSTNRILTTHAGSLPRPQSLIALHTAKFGGAQVAEAALAQAVEAATRTIIAKQIEAGIDIINNGELGRESFFTYVQHRMTGFGGTGVRPIMADLSRYPGS
ncbi:MAG: epoxyalkane--coenzyme M transferase, partial [Anaerolineae bacterium]|nr:epoxyalkane--coenzyme M transferase [Anaerolineae bacterium]